MEYLADLLKEKKQLAVFPQVFRHMERLVDEGKLIFLSFLYLFQLFLMRFTASPSSVLFDFTSTL